MGFIVTVAIIVIFAAILLRSGRANDSLEGLLGEGRNLSGSNTLGQTNYYPKGSVFNRSEEAFFFELVKRLPVGYYVFPNMRIADILNIRQGVGFYNRRNKVLAKHIDFVICNPQFRPVVAVEVNGSSHHRADRIESDEIKHEVFVDAGLPLVVVQVGTNFSESAEKVLSVIPKP